ncbi:Cystatin-12 [Tupaia chinensis]|uniref:Cystatin-12 n=1 Tax=Tupaia chinensis TaxID=246437 RepID=L8YDG2_TUPCH|nr:Cystatin-12 [Tupaia chinensis]
MLQQVALAVGLIVLGTHVCSSTFVDIDKNMPPFTVCVEFAVFQFNEQQEDEFAYKFLRVRRSQRQVSGRSLCTKAPGPGFIPAF